MEKLTLRSVLNSVLDFNLLKVKKVVFVIVIFFLVYGVYSAYTHVKPIFSGYMLERQVASEIAENEARIKSVEQCEKIVLGKAIPTDTLEYHIDLHSCYYASQGYELTSEYIEYLNKQWAKDPSNIRLYLDIDG